MSGNLVRIVFLIACVLNPLGVSAQHVFSPIFKNGETVCFVGNSITQNGGYQHYIYLYHATRFPDHKVAFYNCGVGGDVAAHILRRIQDDVFIHNPDHLVLMVGMNDINRTLYAEKLRGDTAVARRKLSALETYRKDTEELVRQFTKRKSGVTLIKPSIYDQTAVLETENMYGANDALGLLGKHIDYLGRKYGAGIVDFWTLMNEINLREQKKDPKFTIVGKDRIHPESRGHLVMAYQFLKTKKAPAYVSKIVVRAQGRQNEDESINCKITDLIRKPDLISFHCLEGSLPFPVPDNAREAIVLVPFQKELNNETLQVSGLATGMYDVLIDSIHVDTWSATDLGTGVNIALIDRTPQYQQAMDVLRQCTLIRQLQGNLRQLKRVENRELEAMTGLFSIDAVGKYLTQRLETKYKNDRYEFNQKLFSDYMTIKPKEGDIAARIPHEVDKLYTLNKPTTHLFEIRRHE
jgi:lysophospholipase L1-like esterase